MRCLVTLLLQKQVKQIFFSPFSKQKPRNGKFSSPWKLSKTCSDWSSKNCETFSNQEQTLNFLASLKIRKGTSSIVYECMAPAWSERWMKASEKKINNEVLCPWSNASSSLIYLIQLADNYMEIKEELMIWIHSPITAFIWWMIQHMEWHVDSGLRIQVLGQTWFPHELYFYKRNSR